MPNNFDSGQNGYQIQHTLSNQSDSKQDHDSLNAFRRPEYQQETGNACQDCHGKNQPSLFNAKGSGINGNLYF